MHAFISKKINSNNNKNNFICSNSYHHQLLLCLQYRNGNLDIYSRPNLFLAFFHAVFCAEIESDLLENAILTTFVKRDVQWVLTVCLYLLSSFLLYQFGSRPRDRKVNVWVRVGVWVGLLTSSCYFNSLHRHNSITQPNSTRIRRLLAELQTAAVISTLNTSDRSSFEIVQYAE